MTGEKAGRKVERVGGLQAEETAPPPLIGVWLGVVS